MMAIWHLIEPETQLALSKLYKKLAGYDFRPPVDKFLSVKIDPKLEILVRVEKLVRRKK